MLRKVGLAHRTERGPSVWHPAVRWFICFFFAAVVDSPKKSFEASPLEFFQHLHKGYAPLMDEP